MALFSGGCGSWDVVGAAGPRVWQGLAGSLLQLQPLGLWEAALGKPGEGKGGEKEPLCRTIPGLVPGLSCCWSQTIRCREEEEEEEKEAECSSPWHPWEQSSPDALGSMPVSISSGVSLGKLRHKECLRFHKAASIQAARAVLGLSTLPGPPSSHQPTAGSPISPARVVRGQVGPAVGMASVPTGSA